MIKLKLHPDLINIDMENIELALGQKQFGIFLNRFEKEIKLLHKEPIANTAALKKPTLSLYNYRKLKFHSDVPKKGVSADMRLVYRFIEESNTLQFLAVGFRRSSPNVYEIAENRDNKNFVGL